MGPIKRTQHLQNLSNGLDYQTKVLHANRTALSVVTFITNDPPSSKNGVKTQTKSIFYRKLCIKVR